MSKLPGKCIFCRSKGLSKEHLFADWLRELFPRSPDDWHTLSKVHAFTQTAPDIQRRQGHSGSKKVRKVCTSCNNGWVGLIDEAAKYVAIPIIRGDKITISEEMQIVLARWLTKVSIVGDSLNRGANETVIVQEDRSWFMDHKIPIPGWQVFIGFYEEEQWRELAISQQSAILNTPAVRNPLRSYVQATCIGMGNLFVFIFGTGDPQHRLNIGNANPYMRQIWPFVEPVEWPIIPAIPEDITQGLSIILRTVRFGAPR